MIDINAAISIITLIGNTLNRPIKDRDCQPSLKKILHYLTIRLWGVYNLTLNIMTKIDFEKRDKDISY